MINPSARPRQRMHLGYRDLSLPSLGLSVSLALALALGLLALFSFVWSQLGDRAASPALPTTVQLGAPRVPSQPVYALERTDLSIVASNMGDRALNNVTLELEVLQPDGTPAMTARQSHITLQPGDSRAIYWQWRVPGQLASGAYTVQVQALDASGRPLGNDPAEGTLRIIGRDGR